MSRVIGLKQWHKLILFSWWKSINIPVNSAHADEMEEVIHSAGLQISRETLVKTAYSYTPLQSCTRTSTTLYASFHSHHDCIKQCYSDIETHFAIQNAAPSQVQPESKQCTKHGTVFLSKPTTYPLVSVLVSCPGDAATIYIYTILCSGSGLQGRWRQGGKDGIGGMS